MKKDIKIVVKCKGLSVRTNDLEMGLGILDQIAKYGIMGNSIVSNSLLEKASTIIDDATRKLSMFNSVKKTSDSLRTLGIPLRNDEVIDKVIDKQLDNSIHPIQKVKRRNIRWTKDEERVLETTLKMKPGQLIKHPLLKNKTLNQIHQKRYTIRKSLR